jgi:hypothetical protein
MKRNDLTKIVIEALKYYEGAAPILDICKYVWQTYEEELRHSGDLFYTWQYDIRWAGTELRKNKIMKSSEISNKGIWELA